MERDLGTTLQDASTFIKQHFINIMKPTLIVAVIPLVIGGFLMMTGMQDFYGNMDQMRDPSGMMSFISGMFSSYFFVMLAFIMAYIMIIGYIKLYVSGQEVISLNDLTGILKDNILTLFLSSIILVIVTYIGMFLCLLPGIYLAVVFAHFYAIAIIEDSGFGNTWSRCFKLIKDNWWSTFGLYVVTYLIAIGIMILFYIPMYVIIGIDMFNSIQQNDPEAIMNSMSKTTYIIPFYYMLGLINVLLFAVVSTFRYYTLVENKEGTGEQELINKL